MGCRRLCERDISADDIKYARDEATMWRKRAEAADAELATLRERVVAVEQQKSLRERTVTIEEIARLAHEVNRAYCLALGDSSQPAWEDASEWQKESARKGVEFHLTGDHGPEASHESWFAQKVADGWTYGPEKRPDLKQHPCMVPFNELPREQQAKDYLFRAVVHAVRDRLAAVLRAEMKEGQ